MHGLPRRRRRLSIRHRLTALFPKREFHYRTRGRIRYFFLSGRVQLGLAAIFTAAVSWSIFTTFYFASFDGMLREATSELARVRSGERQLLQEVDGFNTRFRDLGEAIARNRAALIKVAGRTAYWTDADPAQSGAADARAKTKAAIRSDMQALSESWQILNQKSAKLEGELKALAKELEVTLTEQGRLRRDRETLSLQVRETREHLAAARAANERLVADIEQGKFFKKERDQFGAKIRHLEEEMGTLRVVNSRLHDVVEERRALRRDRDALAGRVRTLEDELTAMRSSQERMVENLFDRSTKGTGQLERIVSMTGLDVDRMLGASRLDARGGPAIPAKLTDDETLDARIGDLRRRIERWHTLQVAVKNLPLIAPVDSFRVASGFGGRRDPFTNRWSAHNGIDMQNAAGTPVLATGPGAVAFTGWHGGYGWMVEVDHGMGVRTRYAHLQSIAVEKNQKVEARDKVGLMGCSGRCNGSHLHYEVLIDGKAVDPTNFLTAGRYVLKR